MELEGFELSNEVKCTTGRCPGVVSVKEFNSFNHVTMCCRSCHFFFPVLFVLVSFVLLSAPLDAALFPAGLPEFRQRINRMRWEATGSEV